jgi:hypothetical protein
MSYSPDDKLMLLDERRMVGTKKKINNNFVEVHPSIPYSKNEDPSRRRFSSEDRHNLDVIDTGNNTKDTNQGMSSV